MNSFKIHGVVAINKPAGISSAGVLRFLKQIWYPNSNVENASFDFEKYKNRTLENGLKTQKEKRVKLPWKVGHGGTLDPFASGILVVGLGDSCKSLDRYLFGTKDYTGCVVLGYSSETNDVDGKIDNIVSSEGLTEERIKSVIPNFIGNIKQDPPLYSALKLNGKPLYAYARSGKPIPSHEKSRMVNINKLNLDKFYNTGNGLEAVDNNIREYIKYYKDCSFDSGIKNQSVLPKIGDPARRIFDLENLKTFQMSVECGRGTYIRVLAADISNACGSCGLLYSLSRTRQGPFELDKHALSIYDAHKKNLALDAIKSCTNLHNSYTNS
ncbi:hypothetical protein BB559_000511 [Furculomyces boomerangus]|uniref:tRNA pseudouridine(55) synthase n=2 Tax=Harpellales TaxID=61421 RepID=A0A2T9Z4Y2_9FUNG|nr:hypothetical protein BB559_000511 [Furculomyces boomerangus]PVZ97684.1 hypothetical protein BB558_006356 [Smittium angustum]